MTEQTEGAEAIRIPSGPGMWLTADELAAREAAAEVRGAQAVLAAVEECVSYLRNYDGAVMSNERWGEGFLAGLDHAADRLAARAAAAAAGGGGDFCPSCGWVEGHDEGCGR